MSKAGNVFGKIVVWLLVVVLIVAVVGVALFFVMRSQGVNFYVECGGTKHLANSESGSIALLNGETYDFSVKSLTGEEVN